MAEAMAGFGKVATPAALRRQRRGHDEGPEGRRRRPELVSRQRPLARGNSADFLCALSGKGLLAFETRGHVSASHQTLSRLGSGGGSGPLAPDHNFGPARATAPVSRCRMVLVSGQPGADDWTGAGGRASHGRSLRLHSVHWLVPDGDLAGCRLVPSSAGSPPGGLPFPPSRVCSRSGRSPAARLATGTIRSHFGRARWRSPTTITPPRSTWETFCSVMGGPKSRPRITAPRWPSRPTVRAPTWVWPPMRICAAICRRPLNDTRWWPAARPTRLCALAPIAAWDLTIAEWGS